MKSNQMISISNENICILLRYLQSESLQLVVKTPVIGAYLTELFKPAISFVKEVRFYSDIIPAVEQFEQASNVPQDERLDAFIKCLGWRISLDPSKLDILWSKTIKKHKINSQNFRCAKR